MWSLNFIFQVEIVGFIREIDWTTHLSDEIYYFTGKNDEIGRK